MVVHRKKYRPWDPQAFRHLPFRPDGRLPEDDLVFFLLDLLPHLDLEEFYGMRSQAELWILSDCLRTEAKRGLRTAAA